jgi:hypothetical protein
MEFPENPETIHIICGRINRTSAVPGDPVANWPWSVFFGFLEQWPFFRETKILTNFQHDLSVCQKILAKIPNAPKLGVQYEDKEYFVDSIVGNHVYSLRFAHGVVLRNLNRRERLKPFSTTYAQDNLHGGLS